MRREKIATIGISFVMIFNLIIIVGMGPRVSAPSFLYVGGVGGGNFTKIQWAIDNASSGDTVFVFNGTYYENVVINKTINLIGENRSSTIIDGGINGNTVIIENDWVNVSYFTITNSGSFPTDAGIKVMSNYNTINHNNISSNLWYGITLDSSNWNNINYNNIFSNEYGVDIIFSSNFNTLLGNVIYSNNRYNIRIRESENCIFNNNSLDGNGFVFAGDFIHWNSHDISVSNEVNGKPLLFWKNKTSGSISMNYGQIILANCSNVIIKDQLLNNCSIGIQLGYSFDNQILNCTSFSNTRYGVSLYQSDGNLIKYNNLSYNNKGIFSSVSNNNDIIQNNIHNNDFGIEVIYSDNNCIENNTIDNNANGIYLHEANANDISLNEISENSLGIHLFVMTNYNNITYNKISNNSDGIILFGSSGNRIFHNTIQNNTNQADDDRADNPWDNGYPHGGNFWSDYNGIDDFKGPYQDIPGSDGIGDTPYIIDADSQDNYPLMEPNINRTFENYTILKQGWNLISIPLIQEKQNLSTVLQMIEGYYDAVQWYDINNPSDPWKHNKIDKLFGNDLLKLNETMSFWIHIKQPGDTLYLYNGTQPSVNQTIEIRPGWNMVGYPALVNYNRSEGLNNLEFGIDVDTIQWYNASTKTWHFMEPDDNFILGKGYWIHSKVAKVWDVPL